MNGSWLVALIAVAIVSPDPQSAGHAVVKLGDIATVLSDGDVAETLRLADCRTASPWLLTAWRGQVGNLQSAEVFCAADAVNGALRRGQVSWVQRELKGRTWGPWSLNTRLRYAQLVPPARAFAQITGDGDLNRPFRVIGTFSDEELVNLVTFIRAKPSWVSGETRDQVQGDWPVGVVIREPDGTVVAKLSKDRWEGQRGTFRRTADGWAIVGLNYFAV